VSPRGFPLALLILLPLVPAAAEPPACVEVRVGEERVFDWHCLNARLAVQVETERNRQAQAAAALAASQPSGPAELNLFDEAATAQRLGSSFGHSVIPERPVETFRNPLEVKR
jgi:hypothetical protein